MKTTMRRSRRGVRSRGRRRTKTRRRRRGFRSREEENKDQEGEEKRGKEDWKIIVALREQRGSGALS